MLHTVVVKVRKLGRKIRRWGRDPALSQSIFKLLLCYSKFMTWTYATSLSYKTGHTHPVIMLPVSSFQIIGNKKYIFKFITQQPLLFCLMSHG